MTGLHELRELLLESLRRPSLAERVTLRWPDEVAAALGVSRSWLYESGLSSELRLFWDRSSDTERKVRLVLVTELERVIDTLSARWDE